MKIEERLAHLAEHGIGCPQAVKLGGETAVAAWCEQMETGIEAAAAEAEAKAEAQAEADAGAAAAAEEEAAAASEVAEARVAEAIAKAEAEGGVEVETTPEPEDATLGPEPGTAAAIVEDQKAIARQLGAILDRLDTLEGTTDRLTEAVDALAVEPEPEPKPKGKAGKK